MEILECKKAYKSYPAFYTHIKLKHMGMFPEKIDIPKKIEDII